MSALESMIEAVNAAGFQVNNLFQLTKTDKWQANVRKGETSHEFGQGDTPQEALENCMKKAQIPQTKTAPMKLSDMF